MSQQSQFEQKEDGVYLGDVKVATGNADGFRMTKGNADHKEAVAAFLGVEDAPEKPLTAAEIAGIAQGAAMATVRKTKDPVCPIKGAIDAGDKDPEVVAWWYDNHPELAEKKYASRRLINPYA